MDSNRLFIDNLIVLAFLIQGSYLFVLKRRDKNFYTDPKLIGMLPTVMGVVLLSYDLYGTWEFGTNSDTNTALVLVVVMLLLLIFVLCRGFFTGKKYIVSNIDKKDLEAIMFETLGKYQLAYRIEKNHLQSVVTKILLEEHDAFVEMTQRGGSGRSFVLAFERFNQINNFENIIEDMKERVNQTTRSGRFRGIGDLAAAACLLIFFAWVRTMRP